MQLRVCVKASTTWVFPYTHCIFGMLADKDAVEVVKALKDRVDHWHLVPLQGDRGRSTAQLKQQLELAGVDSAAFDWVANSQALAKGGIAKQPPEKVCRATRV